jgi:hypothetical protein
MLDIAEFLGEESQKLTVAELPDGCVMTNAITHECRSMILPRRAAQRAANTLRSVSRDPR